MHSRSILLTVVLGLICLGAAPATRPTESGPLSSPEFFPLAVWLQSTANAAKYKEIGINTYVALWRGPTEEQLTALDEAGMYVVCDQNQAAMKSRHGKRVIAWMHGDEPDNAQSQGQGKGYGPPIAASRIVADYQRLKSVDPSRPVLLNLGQGVAWDRWHGRGVRTNHPEDYPDYLKGCDIASFDIYPVTHDRAEVAGKLWYVGHGVKRLVEWTDGKKPVWSCIETTHIGNPDKLPTAGQIRSEVWLAIVHGANGIIYFCHEFKPKFIEAGLLAHPEQAAGVKAVNEEVTKLAAVINSATVSEAARVQSSETEVPIAVLCKRNEGWIYVFAVSTREKKTKGSFAVAGLRGAAKVEVINESRTVDSREGKFEDSFEGYGVHLYRVRE